jgi:hypothetical protein
MFTKEEALLENMYRSMYKQLQIILTEKIPLPELKICYSLHRFSEIARLESKYYLIYDQYLGQTLNMMNRIMFIHGDPAKKPAEEPGVEVSVVDCYIKKLLAEAFLTNGKLLTAIICAGSYAILRSQGETEGLKKENKSPKRAAYTAVQELFVIAHEIAHLYLNHPDIFYPIYRSPVLYKPLPSLPVNFSESISMFSEFLDLGEMDFRLLDRNNAVDFFRTKWHSVFPSFDNVISADPGLAYFNKINPTFAKSLHDSSGNTFFQLIDSVSPSTRVESFCDIVATLLVTNIITLFMPELLEDYQIAILVGLRHLRFLEMVNQTALDIHNNRQKDVSASVISMLRQRAFRVYVLREFMYVINNNFGLDNRRLNEGIINALYRQEMNFDYFLLLFAAPEISEAIKIAENNPSDQSALFSDRELNSSNIEEKITLILNLLYGDSSVT